MPIQIIPENRQRTLGQELAGGLAQGLPQAFERYQDFQRLQNENTAIKNQIGLDLSGITDPSTRQALIADQLKFGRSMKKAKASQNIDYFGKNSGAGGRANIQQIQEEPQYGQIGARKQIPQSFGLDVPPTRTPSKGKPSQNAKSKVVTGNRPGEQTSGETLQLTHPENLYDEAIDLSRYMTDVLDIDTSVPEAMEILNAREQQKERYNLQGQADIKNRQAFYDRYSGHVSKYINKLNSNNPLKNPQVEAYLNGRAEDIASENTKESEIEAKIAKDLNDLNDQFDDMKDAIPTATFYHKIARQVGGKDRGEKAFADIKTKVDPLLKMGMHDEVRKVLADKHYRPEFIERAISNLSEPATKTVANMPSMGRAAKTSNFTLKDFFSGIYPDRLEGKKLEQFQNNLMQTLETDPNANLILLRQAYGEKGVNWEDFWESLESMMNKGLWKPSPEQNKHLNDLTQPPLDNLDQMAKLFGLADTL